MIGAGERRTERVHQRRRPREAMRLKRHDDAAIQRARRREHRGDLGRMMAVVVDDQNAVRLAAHLEPPLGAAELAEPGGNLLERQAELEPDGDGAPARSSRLCRPGTFSVSGPSVTADCAGSPARRRGA